MLDERKIKSISFIAEARKTMQESADEKLYKNRYD